MKYVEQEKLLLVRAMKLASVLMSVVLALCAVKSLVIAKEISEGNFEVEKYFVETNNS